MFRLAASSKYMLGEVSCGESLMFQDRFISPCYCLQTDVKVSSKSPIPKCPFKAKS